MALKQLQVDTQAKYQLEWMLLHKQHEQVEKEDKLIATNNRDIYEIWAKAEKEIDKMKLQFQEDATKQKEKLTDKQEDQWAMMHEQHDTTLREVLTQLEPADSLRLLTWFFSTTDNPGVAPVWSGDEVLATAMQLRVNVFVDNTILGLENSHTSQSTASFVLTSSPALQTHTPPPPALPLSDIKASGTPVGFSSFTLVISTKPKKNEHSSDSAYWWPMWWEGLH